MNSSLGLCWGSGWQRAGPPTAQDGPAGRRGAESRTSGGDRAGGARGVVPKEIQDLIAAQASRWEGRQERRRKFGTSPSSIPPSGQRGSEQEGARLSKSRPSPEN